MLTLTVAGAAATQAEDVAGSHSARTLITTNIDSSRMVATHQGFTVPKGSSDLGHASPDQQISMRLVLARTSEQQAALDQFVAMTRVQGSEYYGKTLTTAEFRETFGIAQADVEKLNAWLQSNGFEVVEADGAQLHVTFTGTVAQAEAAFGTTLHTYIAKDGSAHFAPASAVKVPKALAGVVLRVEGLQNFVREPLFSFDGPVSDGGSKAIRANNDVSSVFEHNHDAWTSPMTMGGLKSMRDGIRSAHPETLYNVSTAVTLNPTTAVVFGSGSAVTVTTTLTWAAGPGPTGTLTLSDSGSALNATINLSACTAGSGSHTCTYNWTTPSAAATAGTDTITASYGGDSNYATSSGTASLGITYATGTGTPTTLTLSNAPNTVNQGSTTQQTFTFTIRGTAGQGTPTGNVMLYGSGAIGKIAEITAFSGCTTPVAREYVCTVNWNPSASLPAGSYQLAAAYSGNTKIGSYLVVSTTAFKVVATGTTNTTTTVTANPSTVYSTGAGTTFTTHTTWTGSGQPTGSMAITGPSGTYGGGPLGGAVFPAVGQTTSSGSGTYDFGTYTYTYTCTYAANNITCNIVSSDVYDPLPAFGANTITATYSGDTTFKGSSGTTTVTVSAAGEGFPTNTTVAATPSSVAYGAGTTVTYTVNILDEFDAGTQPTGVITLSGTPVTGGSAQLTVNAANCPYNGNTGVATCSITSVVPAGTSAGSYTVTAAYSGDATYGASTGTATVTVTGNTPTSTTASANPTNITYGATVTFTSVTTWTGTGATPTGTVALTCGAGSQGQCLNLPAAKNLSACTINTTSKTFTCSLTYNTTNITDYGSYNFVLTYSGDTNYAGSSASITGGVGGGTTSTTTLVTGANPTVNYGAGTTENWSVTVKGTAGDGAPTGSVTVSANGTLGQLGTANLGTCTSTGTGGNKVYTCPASGTYTVPATTAAGSYTITFAYSGDPTYTGSSATTTLTVNADATSTSVSANPSSIAPSGSSTVTATVTNTTVSSATPMGSVSFKVGTTSLGSCTLTSGSCNISVSGSSLASGSNSIVATYAPSPANWTASSGSTSVTVQNDTTSTAVTAMPSSIGTSGSTSVKATVTDTSNSSSTPAGTVAFKVGSTNLGSCTLSAGACSITVQGTSLASGSNTIVATYTPASSSWKTSTGSTTVTVNADITFSSVSHDMGSVTVGSTSAVYGVYMTNNSTQTVNFTVVFSNTTAGFFESSYKTLAPGASTELNFGFKPTATGPVSTTWSLSGIPNGLTFGPSNGGTLTGAGVAASKVTITTNGHNFGTVGVGFTSSVFGAVITNSTSSSITLSIGTTNAPFSQTLNNCPATLAAGASCNLQWTFSPTASGTVSQYVPITSSAPIYFGSTAVTSMYLAGTGTFSAVAPVR